MRDTAGTTLASRLGIRSGWLQHDLRSALRSVRQRPLSSAAAVATLAIGIGVNAAAFSVVDWVLLRPLPYPSPQQLVRVSTAGTTPVTSPSDVTSSEFDLFASADAFESAMAFSTATRVISGAGLDPAHVAIARIAGDLFRTLRIAPEVGRPFTVQEVASGAPVVVLGDALWRTRFAADAAISGRAIAIDGRPHTVIGVMPAGRGYPAAAELWRPLTAAEREDDDRELQMVGRLRRETAAAGATSELAALARSASNNTRTAWADEIQKLEVREYRAGLIALFASAGIILLIACSNVAALAGASTADRANELTVRAALGASRSRLVGQLIAESLVLALAGGAVGLLIGRLALTVVISVAPTGLPRLSEIVLDGRVAAASFLASVLAGLVVGVAPAFGAERLSGGPVALYAGASGRVSRRSRGRRVLVLAQAALSVVLIVGAGLLGRSLLNLVTVDHGFAVDSLVAVDLNLRGLAIDDAQQLFGTLKERAVAIDGVEDVSVSMRLPTQTIGLRAIVGTAGREAVSATLRPIDASYFTTTGIALLQGRGFEPTDTAASSRVAVINAALARTLADSGLAVGLRVTSSLSREPLTVVGVAGDATPGGEPDRPAIYVPLEQSPIGGGYLIVRARTDPAVIIPALISQLRSIAAMLPLDRVRRLTDDLAAGRALVRFHTVVAGTFAGLALLLATIGVYGLAAGEVVARWRELAVRLALGSSPRAALWSVMQPSAMVLLIGAGLGMVIAIGLAPAISTLLYGVTARDITTLLTAPIVLALVGIAAAVVAALRVLHADPASTLRGE